jgi:hypothetical protein
LTRHHRYIDLTTVSSHGRVYLVKYNYWDVIFPLLNATSLLGRLCLVLYE